MKPLFAALGAFALCLPVTAFAQADGASHAQLVDKLIAALPPGDAPVPAAEITVDGEKLDAVTARYPARTAEIGKVFAERRACSLRGRSAAVAKLMHAVADSMSDVDLRAMIAFYAGPDLARANAMTEGSPEWNALLARYPLTRFAAAMDKQLGEHMLNEVIATETACDARATDAIKILGIKS